MRSLKVVHLRAGYRSHSGWQRRSHKIIVDNFSFEFQPGVIYGVLGSNGSGKSTLLRALLDPASRLAGSVLVGDKDLRLGDGAYVPQNPALAFCPWQSIEHEIGLPLYVRGIDRTIARERIRALLADLGVQLPLDRPVSALSGGQKTLVGIARALCVPDFPVAIFDEPFEGLDSAVREKVIRIIRKTADDKRIPILVTSHRREDLRGIGARLCSLEGMPISGLSEAKHSNSAALESPDEVTVPESPITASEDAYMQAIETSSTVFTHHSLKSIGDGLLGILIGIVLWATLAFVVNNEALLPGPSGVARELYNLAESSDQRQDVVATLTRIGIAWVLGNIIAIPTGILIGYHSRVFRLLTPWLLLGRSLPIFALVGVAAGLFPRMPEVQRLFLVVLMIAAFSLQAIAAAAGLVPRVRLWLARIYGASTWYQVTRIMPFETRPAIFSAIEVSLPLAIVVVFVIELFLIPQIGLGKHLYNHFNDRDLSRLFACVLLPGILATLLIPVIRWIGARSIRHES